MDRQTGNREVPATERIMRSIADFGKSDGMMGESRPTMVDRLIEVVADGQREEALHGLHTLNHVFELEEIIDRLRSSLSAWELSALRAGEGAARISYERARQQIEEGYGETHDDDHENGELAYAAAAYATGDANLNLFPPSWSPHWKPSDDKVRNLEKAGALIAAEIDRLLRARRQQGEKPEQPDFDARDLSSPKNLRTPSAESGERPFA